MSYLVELDVRVRDAVHFAHHLHVAVILHRHVPERLQEDGRIRLLQIDVMHTLPILVGRHHLVQALVLLTGVGNVQMVHVVLVVVDAVVVRVGDQADVLAHPLDTRRRESVDLDVELGRAALDVVADVVGVADDGRLLANGHLTASVS